MDVETIRTKVLAREWFHRIDLGNGFTRTDAYAWAPQRAAFHGIK